MNENPIINVIVYNRIYERKDQIALSVLVLGKMASGKVALGKMACWVKWRRIKWHWLKWNWVNCRVILLKNHNFHKAEGPALRMSIVLNLFCS